MADMPTCGLFYDSSLTGDSHQFGLAPCGLPATLRVPAAGCGTATPDERIHDHHQPARGLPAIGMTPGGPWPIRGEQIHWSRVDQVARQQFPMVITTQRSMDP